ncbi:MAG: sterol desaturase family protein [Deltaproteobacteria bacterium]|nr:sterol desaturase family protein [Deltaproteobacteria bacterium]MBI3389246.1 sterol desaturase family protein [Deltaproteobacteria bacterium]
MNAREFLTNLTIISVTMGLSAFVELALPLFTPTPAQRAHRTVNLGLTGVTLAVNWALNWTAAVVALALSLQAPGLMTRLGVPLAAQIVVGFVVIDFSFGYLAHRAMHMSPTLWRAHRIHHSDPFVDVTTTFRNHPIEGVWRFLFIVIPVWILGLPAEAVVLQRLLTVINGGLEHANIRLWPPLDRALSLVWVTPNMHKVHHSRDSVETNSNYGNILSIYDRILRTFTPTERAFSVVYGLDDVDPLHANSLTELLAMPFQVVESETIPEISA